MNILIRQFDGWENAEPADIHAWIVAESTELRSNTQNATGIMRLLGTDAANGLADAMESAGLKLVVLSLASTGLDFGDEETQSMLTKLATDPNLRGHADALKALGQDTRTRWARSFGDVPLPTVEQITLERQMMLSCDWRDQVLLPAVNAAINEGMTIDEIKAEISK